MTNTENILKWIEALESGKYQQTTGAMTKVESATVWYKPWTWSTKKYAHCCLGVACQVAMKNGVPVTAVKYGAQLEYDNALGTLPHSVWQWLGFETSDPVVGVVRGYGPDIPVSATTANDDKHWDFAKIAQGLRELYLTNNNNTEEDTTTNE